ncbi:TetR/AcrR family transcriptional regulator [Pelagibius sp.]|uniref:TetR/AcrR family transcriptional regulator n=1 Tax=Pelagibius sp. TaxID=1931238 RepID=UPI00261D9AD1|nr:TetR/AcrR family transcriptional regulator [Pelagibius sp.]
MPASRRDDLLETAIELFTARGYRATGIDAILAKAGVAKMTLYNNFESKEALILAALKRGDERTRQRFAEEIAKAGDSARDKLLAVFGRLESWFSEPAFNGCMFQKAAADYPDAQDPIHAMAAEHKRLLRAFLEGLAREAGALDPAELAAQLQLLIDGAISQAQICGGSEAAVEARRAAGILIATAVPRADSS